MKHYVPEALTKIELDTLAKEYDISKNNIYALYYKYLDVVEVENNIDKGRFETKFNSWYENKHKLTNMDEFKATGLHWEEFGVYTKLGVNKHGKSQYMRFWKEEERRCLEGYHIGRDWIPGYMYYYLNYTPIPVVKDEGEGLASRNLALPDVWDGDYYYFHYLNEAERCGNDAVVLKARRKGYSLKGGSMLNRNYHFIRNSNSFVYAEDSQFLTSADGILTKAWDVMFHMDEHTPFGKRRSKKNTDVHKKASYIEKVNNIDTEKGFMSNIVGVSLKDNPNKARGVAARLILYEEAGSFKSLLKAWIIGKPSVYQGRLKFGLRVAFGTGGDEGNGFDALKELFYKAKIHTIHTVPNVWTPNSKSNKVGWFHPDYINMDGYNVMDKDGNSDMKKAYQITEEKIQEMIDNKASNESIERTKAENPRTPEDACLQVSKNIFPTLLIKEVLGELETNPMLQGLDELGMFEPDGKGGAKFRKDLLGELMPVDDTDNKNNTEGAVQMYEDVYKTAKDEIIPDRYIISIDPVDFNKGEVGSRFSLASAFCMDTFTNMIVCEYTARPEMTDDFNEQVRLMSLYYNAFIMYENNLKGFYTYFMKKGSEYLLADEPKLLKDKLEIKSKSIRKKGVTIGGDVKLLNYALRRLASWLKEKANRQDDEDETLVVQKIRSKGLLKELANWNPDGNFDRVSAMAIMMIYLDEIELYLDDNMGVDENDSPELNFYARVSSGQKITDGKTIDSPFRVGFMR